MRYLIYGAGAIGGTIAAALQLSGQNVALIARGAHLQALQSRGLHFVAPGFAQDIPVNAVQAPAALAPGDDDVVILAMKSQHTLDALLALRAATSAEPTIICAQNGVENERLASRWFRNVYAMMVHMPASHLEPGSIEAHARNVYGLLDFGEYPGASSTIATASETNRKGTNATRIVADLRAAGFACELRARIMPWKYRKLVLNLGNGLLILTGEAAENRDIMRLLRGEAAAVFGAANIEVTPDAEYRTRADLLDRSQTDNTRRVGSSTWQSLLRGALEIETDYLNGEVVMLGRLHGLPTPVNALIQSLAAEHARARLAPGSHSPTALLGRARMSVQELDRAE